MKSFFHFAWIGALLLGLSACKNDAGDAAKTPSVSADSAKTKLVTNDRVVGVARIEPEDGITELVAGATGRVLSVLIDDNQSVQKGQTLLTIDESVETSQLNQAKSKLEPQKASIAAQRATLEATKVSLKNAREVYQRNVDLYNGKAATKQAVDDSRHEVERLEKDVAAAEAQVAEASSKIGELQADINYFETVLRQKKMVAPMAGKVLKVNVKAGNYVQNDLSIADFAPAGALVAKTEVDETFADRVQKGQKAYILSQTSGDTLATGSVYFLADYLKSKSLFKDQSTELEDRRVREVHIKLESGTMPIIGSRVDCVILLK